MLEVRLDGVYEVIYRALECTEEGAMDRALPGPWQAATAAERLTIRGLGRELGPQGPYGPRSPLGS